MFRKWGMGNQEGSHHAKQMPVSSLPSHFVSAPVTSPIKKSPVHFTPHNHSPTILFKFTQIYFSILQRLSPRFPIHSEPLNDISLGYQKFIPHISSHTLLYYAVIPALVAGSPSRK